MWAGEREKKLSLRCFYIASGFGYGVSLVRRQRCSAGRNWQSGWVGGGRMSLPGINIHYHHHYHGSSNAAIQYTMEKDIHMSS